MAPTRLDIETDDGIHLLADAYGDADAPPVLLLHGSGQTRHAWARTARALAAAGRYAVTVDLRGHGESGWSPDGSYETTRFAADVALVARNLGRAPAIVGASLGGRAALLAIGEATTPLAACLVLVDIAVQVEPAGARRIGSFLTAHPDGFASLEEVAAAVSAYLPQRRASGDLSGLAKNVRQRADGRLVWHWDPRFMWRDGRRVRHTTPEIQQRLRAAARATHVPVLLVRGMSSDLLSDEVVDDLRGLIPHLEVAEVAGAAHMVAGDRNDRFNAAVVSFLTSSPR